MKTRIEKLAIIAMSVWLLSLILDPILMAIAMRLGGSDAMALSAMSDVLPITIKGIVDVAVHLVVAVWLFKEAKRNGNSASVWGLLGLVFSILAVVVYLLCEILNKLKTNIADNQSSDPT